MANAVRSTGVSVVGMGWYRSEDWERLLQVISDRDEMYDSYAEWRGGGQRGGRAAGGGGVQGKRGPGDPGGLAGWGVVRGGPPKPGGPAGGLGGKSGGGGQQG